MAAPSTPVRPVVSWRSVCDPDSLAALAAIILGAVSPVDDTTGHNPPPVDHPGADPR